MANNRWYRIIKDALFVALAVFLIIRGRMLGAVVGILAGYWYVRDLALQLKMLRHENENSGRDKTEPKVNPDEKITLSPNAKEVDFEKE